MKNKLYVLLLALLSTPLSGNASSIISEDIVGDFNAGQIFSLSEGDNHFIGSQVWGNDPVDGFRFVVPEGFRATIVFNYQFSGIGLNQGSAWIWDLSSLTKPESCTPGAWAFNCVNLLPSEGTHITSEIFQTPSGFVDPSNWSFFPLNTFSLKSGAYLLGDNYGFSTANSVFSYSVNIGLVSVPIPSAVILFGSSLIVFFGVARRKVIQ